MSKSLKIRISTRGPRSRGFTDDLRFGVNGYGCRPGDFRRATPRVTIFDRIARRAVL